MPDCSEFEAIVQVASVWIEDDQEKAKRKKIVKGNQIVLLHGERVIMDLPGSPPSPYWSPY